MTLLNIKIEFTVIMFTCKVQCFKILLTGARGDA